MPTISDIATDLCIEGWNDDYIDIIRDDASRSLMGSSQENWFYRQLSESAGRGATWRVIGNQIIFSRIVESYGVSGDNWNVRHHTCLVPCRLVSIRC